MRRTLSFLTLCALALMLVVAPAAIAIPPPVATLGPPPLPTPTPMALPAPAPGAGGLFTLLLAFATPDTLHKVVVVLAGVLATGATEFIKLSKAKLFAWLSPRSTNGARAVSLLLAFVFLLIAYALGGPAVDVTNMSQVVIEAFLSWLVGVGVYHGAVKPDNNQPPPAPVTTVLEHVPAVDTQAIVRDVIAQLGDKLNARYQ